MYTEVKSLNYSKIQKVSNAFSAVEISEKLVGHAKQVKNIFRRPYLICQKLLKHENKLKNTCAILPWDLFLFRRSFAMLDKKSKLKHISQLFPEQTSLTLSHPALFYDTNDQNQPILISISTNYSTFVKEKKIIPIRSTITRFVSNGFQLKDGSFHEVDAVIYCTGYNKSIENILNILEIKFDRLNEKNLIDFSLYKCTFHPDIKNLAFIGLSTGLLFIGTELQAKWACMVFSSKFNLPNRKFMKNYIEIVEEEKNPKHLSIQYPNGGHLALTDRIASEMDLLPFFGALKQTDPEIHDLFWNYGMIPTQYFYKRDSESAIALMKQVKLFSDREYELDGPDNDIDVINEFSNFYKFYCP